MLNRILCFLGWHDWEREAFPLHHIPMDGEIRRCECCGGSQYWDDMYMLWMII